MTLGQKAQRKLYNAVGKIINKLSQAENSEAVCGEKSITPGSPELLCEAAVESAVLLKNEGVLPVKSDETVAVFGRVQIDWLYVGYGSGGDVVKPYTVNLLEGLKNEGVKVFEPLEKIYTEWCEKNPPDHGFWGHWPRFYPEMPLSDNTLSEAAEKADIALVVIGRAAGEDRENLNEKGSYLLTDEEEALLKQVSTAFEKTAVILNIGSLCDLSFFETLPGKTAILIPWQGGMESGNAVAKLICGKASPSGKLTDTAAKKYSDYPSADNFGNRDFNCYTEDIYVGYRYFETFAPEKVLYPFGFGLSYTDFEYICKRVTEEDGIITAEVNIKNTGNCPGKEVLQLYAELPQGKLGKPKRTLAAFAKTNTLLPGETAGISLEVAVKNLASFDDSGKTGRKNSWVLEDGTYRLHLGTDVRNTVCIHEFDADKIQVVKQCLECCAPVKPFKRLSHASGGEVFKPVYENVPLSSVDLKKRITDNLPKGLTVTGDKGHKLDDVKAGKVTAEEFVAQLMPDELEAISRGDYTMDSPLGAKGNAGALGGVLESLRSKGIPPIITTDGPSGIRLKSYCSLLPVGTALASMWNPALTEEVYALIGQEMELKGSDILLAPGMNIHRNPLCGRNFEYYSEDPLIAGKTAAAAVNGIQSTGKCACPKHFACNSQETNRNRNDSVVSARALREIYLKGFEICIEESNPKTIMTSYNKINGVWSHYNYDLCTTILRREWGFKGAVMTDWWMQYTKSPEFPNLRDNAYRVRAGVDILMPGGSRTGKKKPDGSLLETLGKPDGITIGELQRTAEKVLTIVDGR